MADKTRKKEQKSQKKKERKTQKRKKLIRKAEAITRAQEARAKKLSRYPKIVVEQEGADPEFISLVNEAVCQINFDDPSHFSACERSDFRMMAKYCADNVVEAIYEAGPTEVDGCRVEAEFFVNSFYAALGTRIFKLIPEAKLKQYLPFNDMRVFLKGNVFVIKFTQMLRSLGLGGWANYSRHEPTVSIDGVDLKVSFAGHGIERLCERLNPRWLEYMGAGDVHAVLSHCRHFELVTLYNGQPAFTFYDYCDIEGFVHHRRYLEGILGSENYSPSKGRAYYRVGYCPIVVEGEFAKAITFLYPGYTNTPEYGTLCQSNLPYFEKERMKSLARENNSEKTIVNGDMELIQFFHDNGVPQVIQSHKDFFSYK